MDDVADVLLVGGILHGARMRLGNPISCLVLSTRRNQRCTYVRHCEMDNVLVYAPPEMDSAEVARLGGNELKKPRERRMSLGVSAAKEAGVRAAHSGRPQT